MAKYRIRIYGDPVLRKQAEDVTEFGENLEQRAADMVDCMIVNEGIGLAAPQVGISERFLVIGMPVEGSEESEGQEIERRIYAMSNPEILDHGDETDTFEEGCLSLPGISENVERYEEIRVRYQNLKGENVELEAYGLFARVIQHEMDHLDGVLFIDRLSPLKRSLLRSRLKRLKEEYAETTGSFHLE